MSPPASQQSLHQVPRATVESAVASLTKWMRARTAEGLPNLLADERDDLVLLQLSLRKVPASPTSKPHLLPLPYPLYAHPAASICLISDDRPNSRSPAASDILAASKSLQLPVSEVIPLSTLRTDYRPYESRRRLAGSHDLFLADRAILPLLPRLLGKSFYSTKKAPFAVDFTRAGWPEQVRKVLSSTFLYLRSGACCGIKVGTLDMEEDEIVQNVLASVEAAVEKVPKKWANVRALHLKAVDSVALPIFQALPELGMKIDVPARLLEAEAGHGEVIDSAEVKTGRKRKDKKASQLADGNGGDEVAIEESGKRKRNKKEQVEDVVMEEAQGTAVTKKKRVGSAVSFKLIPNEEQKVGKMGKKSRPALDKIAEDASVEKKSGKKSEYGLEEVGNKKRKGKKGDSKEAMGEVEDFGRKKKGKREEVKEGKKKSMNDNGGDGQVLMLMEGGCVSDDAEKKSKGKKSNRDKMKNISDDSEKIKGKKSNEDKMKKRTRVRV